MTSSGNAAVGVFALWAALAALAAAGPLPITINTATPAATTLPTLGMGWEMWQMFNYLADLNDPAYIALGSHLSGATVRVGGITADWTTYDLESTGEGVGAIVEDTHLPKPLTGYWPLFERNITRASFKSLLSYFSAAGISVIFDLSELHGRQCNLTAPGQPWTQGHWCEGEWDMSNVAAFLQYIHDNALYGPGSPLVAFELGNELVTHLDPVVNTADIKAMARLIQQIWADVPQSQRPGLYAPSTDACSTPAQLDIMRNITGVPGVLGYTFHSYPGGGGVKPTLPELLLNATWLRNHIAANGPQGVPCFAAWNAGPRAAGLQLLVTETSSSWATGLSGPAQNSFLNGFFSLSEWGQYAPTGLSLVARWAYTEASSFALIARNGSRWDVAHDYFLLLTQKRVVGSRSLSASGVGGSDALVYAWCAGADAAAGAVVVTAVNVGDTALLLSLTDSTGAALPASPRDEFVFTAPGGNVSSTTPLLNGGGPLRVGADGSLPPMPPAHVSEGQTLTLPPLSQAFFVLTAARAAACM